MAKKSDDHTLEYLLGFDGQVHRYTGGYWLKFKIKKVEESERRPHGLIYSFTMHGPDNKRLVGFDNAHGLPIKKTRSKAMDHWHRTEADEGRVYKFVNAEKLLDDFFREVRRVFKERNIPFEALE